jgi:hypothetical protein
MSGSLRPCPSCAQHLRAGETRCPFCDAPLPAGFGARPLARGASDASGRPMSRAALLFVGATAAAACGGRTQEAPTPSDGGDAASSDGEAGGNDWDGWIAALPPVQDSGGPSEASADASTDAASTATASQDANVWEPPMAVALYGSAVVAPSSVSSTGGPDVSRPLDTVDTD